MRLIDADVLAGESVKILTWLMERQEQGRGTTLGELHEKWIDSVRKAPTAYDPDKVVEQLEELKSLVPVNRVLDDIVNDKPKELGMLIAYRKAIEIVKGGGVDGN